MCGDRPKRPLIKGSPGEREKVAFRISRPRVRVRTRLRPRPRPRADASASAETFVPRVFKSKGNRSGNRIAERLLRFGLSERQSFSRPRPRPDPSASASGRVRICFHVHLRAQLHLNSKENLCRGRYFPDAKIYASADASGRKHRGGCERAFRDRRFQSGSL